MEPGAIASAAADTIATFVAMWSVLALVLHARTPRIPRAIVRRTWPVRLRAWGNAVVSRFGELAPSAYGRHELPLACFSLWLSRPARCTRLPRATARRPD
ncbi:MAG TPA: hypothetical protein VLX92_19365 [Kofleriaceae bacterium]|nr:hypothetical protein [Kofleriaceae bacterium]